MFLCDHAIIRCPSCRLPFSLWAFGIALVALTSGCSSNVSTETISSQSGNTTVTVLASSTANSRLSQFRATINTLTLTSESGTTVNLLSSALYPEFIHLNGTPEPLNTVSIPEGTYTSATATLGYTNFTCLTTTSKNTLTSSTFADNPVSSGNITVSLPTPIKITGSSMGLTFNLLISQSETYPENCYYSGIPSYSITPTFDLTPLVISTQPGNSSNGKLNSLQGVIASTDSAGKSFTVTSADGSNYGGGSTTGVVDPANGPIWTLLFNASTVFQGISGSSQLAAGMPVDIDAAIQNDGSLQATRVAVYDTDITDTSLWIGPIAFIDNSEAALDILAGEGTGQVLVGVLGSANFSNSIFYISKQFTNLANLPFQASFTSANMVTGQVSAFTFHTASYGDNLSGPPVTTITLLPQTINGTISAISNVGKFTAYTVTLASYDLFPTLAVQSGQTSQLTTPSSVVVYVDDNTQLLNTASLAVGSVARFNGLVFNDNGTLRMDCAQVNDGVTE